MTTGASFIGKEEEEAGARDEARITGGDGAEVVAAGTPQSSSSSQELGIAVRRRWDIANGGEEDVVWRG